MSAIKSKFVPGSVLLTSVGVANGVAGLDSGGKVPLAQLPASVVTGGPHYRGAYDATTALPSSPANGDTYGVTVAGNAGGFAQALQVGDYITYSSDQGVWEPYYTPKTTDQLSEGTTNLFFTPARAQTAAVINSLTASTTQAPTTTAVNTALAAKAASFTRFKERFVLTSAQITAQAIILSHLASQYSIHAGVQGLGLIEESLDGTTGDYAVSTDSGTGFSKLTFKNDLASSGAAPLAVGDVIYVGYTY